MKTLIFLFLIWPIVSKAQDKKDSLDRKDIESYLAKLGNNMNERNSELRSIHFQQTIIGQYHPDFYAKYSGQNSQVASGEPPRASVTSTFYFDRRLWKGAEICINTELSGGKGLGSTLGIAGFPNGETYRVGNAEPSIIIARAFLRQTFSLLNSNKPFDSPAMIYYESAQNQLAGELPAKRLVLTVGKFSTTDVFDFNSYSHDARNQFMNWSLMSAGAWDYPAETKGYTWGWAAEVIYPKWSLKAGLTMVPAYANGPTFDNNIAKANSFSLEFDHKFKLADKPGIVRLIGFYTNAHMGNYELATNDTIYHKDITATRDYGRIKLGFAINAELELSDKAGVFMRGSYNDGKNETWAFTEIDRSLQGGILFKGIGFKRKDDKIRAAFVINGLSNDHKNYLAAGGYGFIIGDGSLNYGYESILESFYNFNVNRWFSLSADYQFVLNPAYNRDRGPIHFIGLRAHVEI